MANCTPIYIAWWTNNSGINDEVILRASTDGCETTGDEINLNNSSNAEPHDAQIDIFADNDNGVIVKFLEGNATSNQPILRINTDSGKTFGPIIKLSENETMDSTTGS
jgi:hypothetical protein